MIHNEPMIRRLDMIHCVLCGNAPCDSACAKFDPSGLLRSIWLRNEQGAVSRLPESNPCVECAALCERACVLAGGELIEPKFARDGVTFALALRAPELDWRWRHG